MRKMQTDMADNDSPNLKTNTPRADVGLRRQPLTTRGRTRSKSADDRISAPTSVGDHDSNDAAQRSSSTRRLVFISHANPEDNPAAAWFATQLTLLGYDVWCDLKNTHGGESDFWLKVQKTIENEAAKFVYILSNTSCDLERKKGIYKELQAAADLRLDNFIVPVRIEKLTRSLPILINNCIYISSENWAVGLHDLVERLVKDRTPRRTKVDFERISSWWPAISVEKIIRSDVEEELVSNVIDIKVLPRNTHFLKVFSERNLLAGFERLGKVFPNHVAFYAHGDYAVTFANEIDLVELAPDFEFETVHIVNTKDFLTIEHKESGIAPNIACNIITYLVGQAWDTFLKSKGLYPKDTSRNRRAIWYPRDGLLPNNKASVAEPGKKTVPIHLVGTVKRFRKTYRWHFGFYPTVDLRVHNGIVLSPKAVISLPPKRSKDELSATLDESPSAPFLVDEKKVLKSLNWWDKEWRQKLLAMLSWLSGGQSEIVIPVGYQRILLSSQLQIHTAGESYIEISDDAVTKQTMEALIEHAPSS